jgi:hypothetical protein
VAGRVDVRVPRRTARLAVLQRPEHVPASRRCGGSSSKLRPCLCDLPVPELTPGPYARFDPQKVHNSLTAGSLRGPGKLAVPPILFAKNDESEAIGECSSGRAGERSALTLLSGNPSG